MRTSVTPSHHTCQWKEKDKNESLREKWRMERKTSESGREVRELERLNSTFHWSEQDYLSKD